MVINDDHLQTGSTRPNSSGMRDTRTKVTCITCRSLIKQQSIIEFEIYSKFLIQYIWYFGSSRKRSKFKGIFNLLKGLQMVHAFQRPSMYAMHLHCSLLWASRVQFHRIGPNGQQKAYCRPTTPYAFRLYSHTKLCTVYTARK